MHRENVFLSQVGGWGSVPSFHMLGMKRLSPCGLSPEVCGPQLGPLLRGM